mmetsp:Transcript_18324/g.58271  ORF Transcript_18324/g.58271 Transcript_18324/m.58271 type:complete len:216 (-) Transcript_18324:331-978(-)
MARHPPQKACAAGHTAGAPAGRSSKQMAQRALRAGATAARFGDRASMILRMASRSPARIASCMSPPYGSPSVAWGPAPSASPSSAAALAAALLLAAGDLALWSASLARRRSRGRWYFLMPPSFAGPQQESSCPPLPHVRAHARQQVSKDDWDCMPQPKRHRNLQTGRASSANPRRPNNHWSPWSSPSSATRAGAWGRSVSHFSTEPNQSATQGMS